MNKKISILALILCAVMLAAPLSVFAANSYTTYTYSVDGFDMKSPDAYTPEIEIDSVYMNLVDPAIQAQIDAAAASGEESSSSLDAGKAIDDPRDLFVDDDLNVYIADAANSRIVVLDQYYKLKMTISEFTNDQGVPDSLNTPSGVFVTDDSIYVCDTENNRIVVFDREGEFIRIVHEPKSDVMPANSIYKPVACAVDNTGRIYVISSTTYMGVISLNSDGSFVGFIGAQKVAVSVWQIIWRRFQTAEQRALSVQNVSTEFNNITIDRKGFVYVTTSSIEENQQQANIKSKSGDYAPVKKLNSSGSDIMRRNGFYAPSGEVQVRSIAFDTNTPTGASKIIDVAIGPEDTWSIIDEKRSRVYTYDQDGKMLFAFGDTGMQLGNISSIEAVAYQGNKLLVLDKTRDSFTVYNRTEYGNILIAAIKNNNDRKYDQSVSDWQAILQRNSNFDAAYVGIGKALYRAGDWEGAMDYYKYAYDTENYSLAFKMYRKDIISKFIWLIPIIVIVIVVLIVQFFKFAGKVNKKAATAGGKRTFWEEVLYGFHVIFHPFDGYWDLKHEHRGSVRAALFWLGVTVLTFTYQAIGRSYLYNPHGGYASIFIQVTSLLVPLLLWCTANWCLTTLFDGEGSFKDVFIAVSYATIPLPLLIIPSTILTHILTLAESGVVNLLITFAYIWLGILVFTGMMSTHDYTLGKNILTCLGTIVGMALIMFIILLFTGLISKIVGFISSVITEISYRL
ncbi:MAG: YIP1 family protein [Clostridiales bacterium]|nr:YIP1 family protein [Clostridiales bacterium]